MRRKKIAWRVGFSRSFVAFMTLSAGLLGIRALPQNIYREHPPIYVLKPATLQPSIAVAVARRIDAAKKPKPVTNELLCLAQVIWFESGFEPREGIEAVAAVVFNRTQSAHYPHTICGVVYQPYQFSWTADYQKWTRVPPKKYMELARHFVQQRAVLQETYQRLTHFHHISILPEWGRQENMEYRATYGQHKFYAWPAVSRAGGL